jgi:hypothetical protein
VAVQVIDSCTRGAQLVAPYVPFPLPLMLTSLAVGATPLPTHVNTAVIVTGVSAPRSSATGLTLVTLIDVAIPPWTTWFTLPVPPLWLLSPE